MGRHFKEKIQVKLDVCEKLELGKNKKEPGKGRIQLATNGSFKFLNLFEEIKVKKND